MTCERSESYLYLKMYPRLRKWINQCVADNKGDAAEDVVLKYCTCMNNKMSDNETQSITQWEKTHVAERKACDAEAGWK